MYKYYIVSIHPLVSNVPSLPHYRLVSRLLGLALVYWAFALFVSIAYPFAFHISVFFHSLFTCH